MKILIGLIEHFGDVVACEPVARYLRDKYPEAHLSWAILKPYRELIDANPHIDETVVLGCLTEWIRLYKHAKYDLVVDLHVNLRVCEECRVPLVKEHGNPFVNAYEYFDYGAILEAFCLGAGLPKLSAQPQVYVRDADRAAVDALRLPPRYCVIHRESNSYVKDWPDENWRGLVSFLGERKIPVVDVGTRKAKSGSGPWSPAAIDLLNRTSLLETAEVIRRARFYIGIDSGPAHFANAVKTPGIILLGRIGYFRQYMPFTGFYASRSPEVRVLRNLTGVVGELPLEDAIEAAHYMTDLLDARDEVPQKPRSAAPPTEPGPASAQYRRMITESGFFDRSWYVTHHPECSESGLDPLDYFGTVGAARGHSPGEDFDAVWYRTQRPDLAAVSDPLKHFLEFGRSEGLVPRLVSSSSGLIEAAPPMEYAEQTPASLSSGPLADHRGGNRNESMPRIFAFYLPQFHPIAQNNYGHRPGFTEWDNVIKSKPLFKGHYQPRVPGELGYYDLRSLDVMRQQIALANNHGIAGFCFYFYYFQGKRLLYKPIENYIKSDLKAPFLFLWANENWSRRWDGGDNEVIVSQNHSAEDDLLFIRGLLGIFSDDRYVKVEGKPVLAIYKTHLFPNIRRSTELWRDEAVKGGFPGLYLVMADDWHPDPRHPQELGFDASYEIPSNLVPERVLADETGRLGLKSGFEGRIVDYRKFASFHLGRPFPDYKRFRTVMAPWDNTPRYGTRAMVHTNTDNDSYRMWLSQALADTRRRYAPDERIVFLHSWNEWCEGTYVEPDGRYGRRLLEETRAAVEELARIVASRGAEPDSDTAPYFYRLMREKDEGAARSLQAMRQQNMYLHREIERQRAQLAKLTLAGAQQAASALSAEQAVEEFRRTVSQSMSWRVTKPLRALTDLIRKR